MLVNSKLLQLRTAISGSFSLKLLVLKGGDGTKGLARLFSLKRV